MGFIPFLSLISVCQLHTSPSNRGHSTSKEAAKDSYVHKSEDSWLYGFLPLFKKYTACHKWTVDNIIPGYPQLSASSLVSRFIDLNSCKIRPTPSILWLLTLFKKESVCTWLHFPPGNYDLLQTSHSSAPFKNTLPKGYGNWPLIS